MQTSSSANRTCRLSVSAVEWTATVLMSISAHARMIRRAISPRLAIRIFLNTPAARLLGGVHLKERLVELHRLPGLGDHAGDRAAALRLDLVHELHGLDQ